MIGVFHINDEVADHMPLQQPAGSLRLLLSLIEALELFTAPKRFSSELHDQRTIVGEQTRASHWLIKVNEVAVFVKQASALLLDQESL
nr:hypothetical protein [Bradyrhizobium diazoefficiens]